MSSADFVADFSCSSRQCALFSRVKTRKEDKLRGWKGGRWSFRVKNTTMFPICLNYDWQSSQKVKTKSTSALLCIPVVEERQVGSVPMRLVPFSLVVRRTLLSLPLLRGAAWAKAAVLVAASTTTCGKQGDVGWRSPTVLRPFKHKEKTGSSTTVRLASGEELDKPTGAGPSLPHCSSNAMATRAWVVCWDDLYNTSVRLAVTRCSGLHCKTERDQWCRGGK